VADRGYADCLPRISELVDDAVGADAERAESLEAPAKRVSGERLALEQSEGVLDGVDQHPVEFEQLSSRATREDDAGHCSVGGPPLGELASQIRKRDCLLARELSETGFDRGKRLGVREDLCGLLQCVVLVYRNQGGGRSAVAGNDDMVSTISHVAKQFAEVASELADRHCLGHLLSVPHCVHSLGPFLNAEAGRVQATTRGTQADNPGPKANKGAVMSGPFIFIATNRLKEGKLEEERKRVPGLCDFIEANEPRLIAFNEYASEDGREVGVVQVHPAGEPSDAVLEMLSRQAGAGVPLTVKRHHLGGFTRAQRG
jgi:hypothetical protein